MNASLGIAALTTEIPLYDGYDQELEDVRRLRNEMRRLNDLGYSLVPLGGGEDGKSPLVKFAGRGPLPLPIVLRRMEKAGSLVYGIRLGGLVALDVDAGGEEAEAAILQRFGVSAFQTQTRRGSHHFYRLEEGSSAPASFNDRGIVVDVKSGSESYVVGPWSIRGDGTVYCVAGRELPKPEELPILKDLEALRVVGRGPIRHRGHRHKALLRLAVRLAPASDDLNEMLDDLHAYRDWECEDPEEVSDAEVQSIAEWAWKKRLENHLWAGKDSAVQIPRRAVDTLIARGNGGDALVLLVHLHAVHGRNKGKIFAVSARCMSEAGTLPFQKYRIRKAIEILVEEGLLVQHARPERFRKALQFSLGNPRPISDGKAAPMWKGEKTPS